MLVRFSRFQFREGKEVDGREILRRQEASLRAAEGCEDVWLAQGQHPSTEFILVAKFQDETSLRSFEGRLRSDPEQSGDFFSLMSLTKQPPEIATFAMVGNGPTI